MNESKPTDNVEVFNGNGQIQLFGADSMIIENGCSNGWFMMQSGAMTINTVDLTTIGTLDNTVMLTGTADIQQPSTRRVVTIRHNMDYNDDTVEVLDGTTQLGLYTDKEFNAVRLAEILRWFGHTVRLVDYMFEHDIAEFG